MIAASAVTSSPGAGLAGQPGTARIASIDIFRGLTMAVMIFVNELDNVRGLPWWTHHAKASWNLMTYVDMVYPFFLFIAGLAIPLTIRHRLKKNSSMPALWLHVGLRSASLIVLGLILANADKVDRARVGLNGRAWGLIALLGAVLFWNVYPQSKRYVALFRVLRMIGFVLLLAMYALFRRTTHDGRPAWIDGSYPEILGLIGYTYLAVCILYIPTRRWLWAPFAWYVALVGLCAFSTLHWLNFPNTLPLYFWPFSNGSWACITMAGAAASAIFLGHQRWRTARSKMLVAVAFALATLARDGCSRLSASRKFARHQPGAFTA